MSRFDLDDAPARSSRPRYACRGYASSTGHCGALDCETCYPGNRHGEPEDSALTDRMVAAGYEFDGEGEWTKTLRSRLHVARRDHADGRVKKGDTYRVLTTRTVDAKTGKSEHSHRKVVVSRAVAVA